LVARVGFARFQLVVTEDVFYSKLPQKQAPSLDGAVAFALGIGFFGWRAVPLR